MNVQAKMNVDMVGVETEDRITLLLDLNAPLSDAQKNRPGQAIQIVLDRSGSMQDGRLDCAKESILKLVDRLSAQDSFGVVVFDDEASIVIPNKLISEHNLPQVKSVIRSIRTGGSTDLSAGYLMGLSELQRVDISNGATLLMISDGHANAGIDNPEQLHKIAVKHATEKITTSSIGIGDGYDEKILEAIARGGGGQHRFAYTVDEAIGAISSEVDDLLDKSIVNTIMRVNPVGDLASPTIEIVQQLPYWKDGNTYVVQLGDLYAGENRRFLVDFHVPKMAGLGLCKIADIHLQYLDLASMTDINVTLPVQVNVVPGDVAAGRTVDPVVTAERMVLEVQSEKAAAIEEFDRGDMPSANARIQKVAESLRQKLAEISPDDEQTVESLTIIEAEKAELERLIAYQADFDIQYQKKRMYESYSQKSRSRNFRNPNPLKDQDNNEAK